jgi:hypothetical protein
LSTVDNSAGNGTWYSYISGTLYESESGYSNNVDIEEWGEFVHNTTYSGCLTDWSASASFTTWQRYWYSGNTWSTVTSAVNSSPYCWTTGLVSSGYFTVAY